MNTKIPIAESSKTAENTAENNTKNINTMTELTEHELKNMLSNEVIPKNEIKETLIQFVRWRILVYEQQKSRSLSDIFAEGFQQFNKDDFEGLDKDTRYGLRDCLRANGVYVRKGRGIAVSRALADVVQKDIPWPEDDEEQPSTKPRVYPQQAQAAAAPAAAPASATPEEHHQQEAQQQRPYQQPYQFQQSIANNPTPVAQLPGLH